MAAVDVTLHATEKTDGDNRVDGVGTKGGSNLRGPAGRDRARRRMGETGPLVQLRDVVLALVDGLEEVREFL